MPSKIAPSEESLIAEYAAANDAYMHYDNFSWQVGAVLIAGTFVFWGFLTGDTIEFSLFVVGSTLVTIGLPVPLVVAILWRTRRNERTLKNYLERVKEAEQNL